MSVKWTCAGAWTGVLSTLVSRVERSKTCGMPAEDNNEKSGTPNEACTFESNGGEYWRWCPRCGHELHNEKCKLRCPRCHYFMSCSDFD